MLKKNTESKLVVSADDKTIIEIHLFGENKHDTPEGRISLEKIGAKFAGASILMDRAYEGEKTRELASVNSHEPIVPPKKNRKKPWIYNE